VDECVNHEAHRLGVDTSSVVRMVLRQHFGLAGRRGVEDMRRVVDDSRKSLVHLETAFALLTDGKHSLIDFASRAEAIRALGGSPACEVWAAWKLLCEAHGIEEGY